MRDSLRIDKFIPLCLFCSLSFSVIVLQSLAPQVFPQYLIYIVSAILLFLVFVRIDFSMLSQFSIPIYVLSIFLLCLPIVIGQVTRGTIRWIPLGEFNIQPAEIVRPFLFLFFAVLWGKGDFSLKKLFISVFLMAIPLFLIYIQPSLGVTIVTAVGFVSILIGSGIPRKVFVWILLLAFVCAPVGWNYLAPYQKDRIMSHLSSNDPSGSSYNSIQSEIAVGSGKLFGKGLGKGSQTQLAFLPEKHTDFVFASISEELGFFGALIAIAISFLPIWRLTGYLGEVKSSPGKLFIIAVVISQIVQISIHIGMNLRLFPITGLPLPLISYGGSSVVSTLMLYAIALQAIDNLDKIWPYEIRNNKRPWHPIQSRAR